VTYQQRAMQRGVRYDRMVRKTRFTLLRGYTSRSPYAQRDARSLRSGASGSKSVWYVRVRGRREVRAGAVWRARRRDACAPRTYFTAVRSLLMIAERACSSVRAVCARRVREKRCAGICRDAARQTAATAMRHLRRGYDIPPKDRRQLMMARYIRRLWRRGRGHQHR